MGQSPPTVKTTDQSKAQQLGGGTGFFSTHKPTVRAAHVACPGNLAALKLPLHGLRVAPASSVTRFTLSPVFSPEIVNQVVVVQRCKLPYVVLVNALYVLGQVLVSLDCTMKS